MAARRRRRRHREKGIIVRLPTTVEVSVRRLGPQRPLGRTRPSRLRYLSWDAYLYQLLCRLTATPRFPQSHPVDASWPVIGSMPERRCSCVAEPFRFTVIDIEPLAATLSSVVDGVSGTMLTTPED